MKVILPDGKELELPDGATGLDAARAIGPKLAEQAVLVRSNGAVQDLRLPLADGAADPDPDHPRQGRPGRALRPAPLERPPARRGRPAPLPGREDRDRPADRERLLLRLRVPRADRRRRPGADRGGGAPRARRGPRVDARGDRRADEARDRFRAEDEPYKVELVDTAEGAISLYTQGDFTDLCRGPHLQNSAPIKAFKLTGLAGAYWRGDEHNTQLTRIYGTAFYSQEDLDAHLERLEEAKQRDHRRLGTQLDLFHFYEHLARLAVLAPEGDGDLERARGPPPPRERARGYVEVQDAAHLRQGALGHLGALGEVPRDTCSSSTSTRTATFGLKPMNCPGHCCSSATRLRSYRELPLRYAEAAPLHRNELAGALHGLLRVRTSRRTTRTSSARAEQIEDEIFGCLDYAALPLRPVRARARAPSSRRGPRTSSAPTRSGTSPRRRSRAALERRGIDYTVNEGDGAFYGPKIDLHMTDVLGRSWQIGTIQLDSQMPQRFGLTLHGRRQRRAHAVRDPPRAPRLARALHRHPDRALRAARSRSGSRRCRCGSSRSARTTARRPHALARPARAATASRSTTRDETVGKRIRNAELEKIPFVVVYGDKESDEALAVRERGGEQSTRVACGVSRVRLLRSPAKQGRNRLLTS